MMIFKLNKSTKYTRYLVIRNKSLIMFKMYSDADLLRESGLCDTCSFCKDKNRDYVINEISEFMSLSLLKCTIMSECIYSSLYSTLFIKNLLTNRTNERLETNK